LLPPLLDLLEDPQAGMEVSGEYIRPMSILTPKEGWGPDDRAAQDGRGGAIRGCRDRPMHPVAEKSSSRKLNCRFGKFSETELPPMALPGNSVA
jgi:hypothetical protein